MLLSYFRRSEIEAKCTDAFLRGQLVNFWTGGGRPDRRVRPLNRFRVNRRWGNLVILAFPGERVLHPHLWDHIQLFFPLMARLVDWHLERPEGTELVPSPGAKIDTAITHDIQRRYSLGPFERMVYVFDEQHDPVTEANPFGTHRGGRKKYFWRRRRIFFRRKVLLRKAIGIPSELVRQLDLAHH